MSEYSVVYKWALPIGGEHEREIPRGAKIVQTDADGFGFRFWTLGPFPARWFAKRTFRVFATGEPIGEEWVYRGTAIDAGYVWHLMERETEGA